MDREKPETGRQSAEMRDELCLQDHQREGRDARYSSRQYLPDQTGDPDMVRI